MARLFDLIVLIDALKDGLAYDILTKLWMIRHVKECLMDLVCQTSVAFFGLKEQLLHDLLIGNHLFEHGDRCRVLV